MVARGEFSSIISGIAVTAGIEPDLAALAGAYVLMTAFAGTLLTRFMGGGAPAGPSAV